MRIGVLGLCGLWALLTVRQLDTFTSDRALWARAVAVNPHLARPALNLASTYRASSEADEAIRWLIRAGELAEQSPRPEETRAIVRGQLLWWTAFGHAACGRPDAQPYC